MTDKHTDYSPIALLRAIRDAGSTRTNERAVLTALVLRADWGSYSARVSDRALEHDTGLSHSDMKMAVITLVVNEYLAVREYTPGVMLYHVNAPLLMQQAAESRRAWREAQSSPFVNQ